MNLEEKIFKMLLRKVNFKEQKLRKKDNKKICLQYNNKNKLKLLLARKQLVNQVKQTLKKIAINLTWIS